MGRMPCGGSRRSEPQGARGRMDNSWILSQLNLEQLDHSYFTLQFIQRYCDRTLTAFLFDVSLSKQAVCLLTLASFTIIPPSQHEDPLQVRGGGGGAGIWGFEEGSDVSCKDKPLHRSHTSPGNNHLGGWSQNNRSVPSVQAPRLVFGDLCWVLLKHKALGARGRQNNMPICHRASIEWKLLYFFSCREVVCKH